MSIHFTCECGRKLKVKDESAGRKVRCPSCKSGTEVPTPLNNETGDDEGVAEGPPPIKPKRKPKPVPEEDDDAGYGVATAPPESEGERRRKRRDSAREARKSREERASRDRESAGTGWIALPQSSLITGVLMMVGAVV